MAVKKFSALCLPCLLVLTLSPAVALAGDNDTSKTIPIDDPAVSIANHPLPEDTDEDNTRAFNTPIDDGRPGEYFFALGAQAMRKGDYKHALAMFKVSASWAYKPSQYNLGVMHINGKGTDVDLPRALAWMALSAERDDPQYVQARQLLYAHLTPDQYQQANVIWRELLPTYSDEHALPRAKSRWRETLANATGSRVGSSAAPVKVGGGSGTLNHMNKPYYDSHDGGHIVTSPGELTGGNNADGAIAYQALRITKDPYDPRVMPVTGNATVGPLMPAKKKDSAPPSPADDSGEVHPSPP